MNDRSHLSIGEVLSLLQQDFPDVTISKIRFLESQGLLDPERTPSGYRKFYDGDIVRLRWILYQQRENFLPLKVIKDRLASGEVDFAREVPGGSATAIADEHPVSGAGVATNGGRPADAEGSGGARVIELGRDQRARAGDAFVDDEVDGDEDDDVADDDVADDDDVHSGRAEVAAMLQEAPTPRSGKGRKAPVPSMPERSAPLFDTGETGISLTLDELMSTTSLTAREIGDLERFGMMASKSLGGTNYYDEDAVLVARLAAAFRSHGIEARHLRMYKVAAEREAGVFEQLLLPMSRKRSPQARRQATELVNELAHLGDGLRSAMLRMLLREYLDGP